MRPSTLTPLAAAIALTLIARSGHAQVTLQTIGGFPVPVAVHNVSGNGNVSFGLNSEYDFKTGTEFGQLFRWTGASEPDVFLINQPVDYSAEVRDSSDTGLVVLVGGGYGSGLSDFVWTESGGVAALEFEPGSSGEGLLMSADGLVVLARSNNDLVRFTAPGSNPAGGAYIGQDLNFPGFLGYNDSLVDMSDDGATIVASDGYSGLAIWSISSGSWVSLTAPEDGLEGFPSESLVKLSADGSRLLFVRDESVWNGEMYVSRARTSICELATQTWTTLPSPTEPADASTVGQHLSANGSVVVGSTQTTERVPVGVFRWTASGGLQSLGLPAGTGQLPPDTEINMRVSPNGQALGLLINSYSGGEGPVAPRAFRHTVAGGFTAVLPLSGDDTFEPTSVNNDISVMVGSSYQFGDYSYSSRSARWSLPQGQQQGGQTVELGGLPSSASLYGGSSDGGVLLGQDDQGRLFRWTPANGLQELLPLEGDYGVDLAQSSGSPISDNGLVTVGSSSGQSGARAVIWAGGQGVATNLGVLPDYERSNAAGVSGDGSSVFGSCDADNAELPTAAFRWKAAGGGAGAMIQIPAPTSQYTVLWPSAISSNGSVVVGSAITADYSQARAFRWVAPTGSGSGTSSVLPFPAGFIGASSYGESCSADGTVIVGEGYSTGDVGRGVRWTVALNGSVSAALLQPVAGHEVSAAAWVSPDGTFALGASGTYTEESQSQVATRWVGTTGTALTGMWEPHGANDAGTVVFGARNVAVDGEPILEPALWTAATGVVDAQQYLEARGVNFGGGVVTEIGVSRNGLVVGGSMLQPNGLTVAFRVTGINFGGAQPPAAPTNVQATDGTSSAHVTVSWNSVTGATGYRVWRGTSESDMAEIASVGAVTTYNDTSAQPGAQFVYGVRAANASGVGAPSAVDSGYRGLAAPTGVAATDGTSATAVVVSWTAVSGASGYRVMRSLGSAAAIEVGSVEGGTTVSFSDAQSSASTSPQYGQVYNYAVRAVSAVGPGVLSAVNAGHLKMVAPTGVTATDGTSAAHVVVSWTAAPGASGYQVLRGEGSATPTQVGTTSSGSVTTFTDTTAVAGKLYAYRVKTTGNPSGNVSEPSSVDSGYRGLSAPTGVAATDGTSAAHVAVTWTAAPGAIGYEVFRGVGSETAVSVGVSTTTSYNDTSADAGVGYQYQVRSTGPSGVTPSALSGSTPGHRRLSPPTGVLASSGTDPSGVVVSWTAAPGATGYQVLRGVGSGTPTQIGQTSGATTFTDTTAVIGTVYAYRVKAVDTDPAGNVSEPSVAANGYRGLVAPVGLAASDGTATDKVVVTWTALTGATGYKVFRGTSESAVTTQVGITSGASATTFNDTTAPAGVALFYGVRGVTAAGDTPPSTVDSGYRGLAAPTGVAATDGTSATAVVVSWTAVSGASGYRVMRSVGSAAAIEVGSVEGGTTVSFSDAQSSASTSPQYGQVYNYAVRAVSAVGPGVLSAVNAGHLKMVAPTGVTATDGASAAHVVVSWTAAPGASGYQVLRGEGNATPTQVGTTSSGSVTTFTDTTAVAGKLYAYRVKTTGNPSGNVSEPSAADSGYRGLSAPTGVAATDGTSAAHVAVTWTAAPGAVGYEVFRGVGSETAVSVGVSTTTSYNDTSADAGVGYQYQVRSTGPSGVTPSALSGSTPGHRRLSPPTGVLASSGTDPSGVVVSWTAAPGATGYQVLRGVGSGTPTQIGQTSGATTFTDTTAVIGTVYAYRVKAVDTDPAGNVSEPSVAANGYRGLVAPVGLAASDGTATDKVVVTWTALTGATGYKVFRGTSESAVTTPVGITSGASATTFNDTTAPAGVALFYGVRGVTAAGDTPPSTVDSGYRGLAAPTGVAATDGTSATAVVVSWTAVSGASGYRVMRSVGSAAAIEVGSVEDGTTVSFSDAQSSASTSPQYGQVYNYAVRAVSAVGPGVLSAVNAGHLKMVAPTGVTATDGASAAHVVVSWTAAPGASGYQVLRGEGNATPTQVGTTSSGSVTTFTDTTAVAGKLYAYRVTTTGNPSGNVSEPSAADSGYRGLSAPTGVAATDGTSAAHVAVTWTAAPGAVSYAVFRDGGSTAIQSGLTGTSFNDTTAVPGTSYSYTVQAVASAGSSPQSLPNAGYRQMSAPQNVAASDGTSSTHIEVTWAAVPGAISYQVFRSGTTPAVATPSTASFLDTPSGAGAPVAGTAYTYTVRAVGATSGALSPASTGNAGYRSLTAPANVLATDGSSPAHVTVTWSAVAGASGYKVRRAIGSGATADVGTVGSVTTFNDASAVPGTWYRYSVAATTAAGPSLGSGSDDGLRGLAAPANVAASDGTNTSFVRVTWQASTAAVGYQVFRSEGTAPDQQVGTVTGGSTLIFDDTSAVPGVNYNFTVRAVGANPPEGLQLPLSPKSTANAGYRQMSAPQSVAASDGTSALSVSIAWQSVEGAATYQVFRSGTTAALGTVTAPSTSFVDTTATIGTRFTYTVKALGSFAAAVSAASTGDFGHRNRAGPTGVQATENLPALVRVTWTLAAAGTPAVSGYEVRRVVGEETPVVLTSALAATATQFEDTTAVPGTQYTYEVRARYTLAGSSPALVVTTLPGSDAGMRPVPAGSNDGGVADAGDGKGSFGGESAADAALERVEAPAGGDAAGGAAGDDGAGEIVPPVVPVADEPSDDEGDADVRECDALAGALEARIAAVGPGALADALQALLREVEFETQVASGERVRWSERAVCAHHRGDMNLDGEVDGADLVLFMDAWRAGDEVIADLDRNGRVDARDAARMLVVVGSD